MSNQKPVVMGTRDVVFVPRAVYSEYFAKPWSEMVAAGEAGSDGLRVEQTRMTSNGLEIRSQSGFAVFRHGNEFRRADVATLFTQGW